MKIGKFITIAALSAFAAASSLFAAKVGEKAPDFTLTDTNGASHSLSDYAGKPVVLEWINHGCPYVKKHYNSGNMQKLQAEIAEKGGVWLSICSSAPGKQGHMGAKEWNEACEDKGVTNSIVLIDEDGKVGRSYNAKVTPHMFVVDSGGLLAYNGAIDSIRSTKASDIPNSENYVLAAVDNLVAGKAVSKTKTNPYGCGVKY